VQCQNGRREFVNCSRRRKLANEFDLPDIYAPIALLWQGGQMPTRLSATRSFEPQIWHVVSLFATVPDEGEGIACAALRGLRFLKMAATRHTNPPTTPAMNIRINN
jgi:hypothetical protein